MDANAVAALLAQPKSAPTWTGWTERSNHAGHFVNVATVLDDSGVSMPGVTVELEVKRDSMVGVCFYLFTIMHSHARIRRRVYQLEVTPVWKRSHNGATVLYGPHEHLLTDEPSPVVAPGVNCGHWSTCALWFFIRAAISTPPITDPFRP